MSTNTVGGRYLSCEKQPESLVRVIVVAVTMVLASAAVSAQIPDHTSPVPHLLKEVLLDPTTYLPAIVAWKATRLDWDSSQSFFEKGWFEQNARFTVSGRSNDTAIGYAAGNRQILTDAVANLQLSLVNNVSARVMERVLMPRYPNHRGLLRTIGWVERSAMASYLSYRLSADHFRQWQENERRGQQLGYN